MHLCTSSVVGIYYRPNYALQMSTRQRGALDELKRIIPQIRQHWPQVQLVVRGDAIVTTMRWCEARGIDYVFGLAVNERLMRIPLQQKAQAQYQQRHDGS